LVPFERNRHFLNSAEVLATLNGQKGADVVNVGKGGSVQGISASLSVTNIGAWSAVTLDASADMMARVVTIDTVGSSTRVTGLAPAMIAVRETDLSAFNIVGGSGNNTFTILNTPLSTFAGGMETKLRTGAGNDTVNVLATTGRIAVLTEAGSNTANVGRANRMDGVKGAVRIDGRGGIAVVNVNDAATLAAQQFSLRGDQITRLNPQQMVSIGFESLTQLNIAAGKGNDSFQVFGSPVGAVTTWRGGNGIDSATILGTGGQLVVDLGDGVGQLVDIGDATHSLKALDGRVTVTAIRPVVARVANQASTDAHQIVFEQFGDRGVSLRRTEIIGDQVFLRGEILFDTISTLDLQNGNESRGTFVYGTPAGMTLNVRGAVGWGDVFWLETSFDRILGPVNYYGEDVFDFAYYSDYSSTAPHTYIMMRDPVTGGPHTSHTTNPVPALLMGGGAGALRDGRLADIAPTLLELMELPQPQEMTGESLVIKKPA
jgi:hypothetical protein